MTTYSVLPETLNLAFVQGDELSVLLDFDIDLTGYTFEAKIIKVLVLEEGNVLQYEDEVSFTQTPVDLSAGTINLSLQENQTAALELNVPYRWFMRWVAPGAITRTVLSGTVSVVSP